MCSRKSPPPLWNKSAPVTSKTNPSLLMFIHDHPWARHHTLPQCHKDMRKIKYQKHQSQIIRELKYSSYCSVPQIPLSPLKLHHGLLLLAPAAPRIIWIRILQVLNSTEKLPFCSRNVGPSVPTNRIFQKVAVTVHRSCVSMMSCSVPPSCHTTSSPMSGSCKGKIQLMLKLGGLASSPFIGSIHPQ